MKINRKNIQPLGVVWAVLAALLWGGLPVQASAETESESELIDFLAGEVPEEAQLEKKVVNGMERITITLDDVSLEDAVRMFAQTTDANIIATSAMMAGRRVTVNLADVDWRPALRSILEIHDLALVERTPGSGVYTITEPRPDAPPPTMVQTFFLDYTTVGEVKETIRSMLGPGATLTAFPSRNALVIRSSESNLGEVEQLLAELDLPARQVLIETRIVELSDHARKQVGIDWSVLAGYQVGLREMEWDFENQQRRELESRERGFRYDYRGRQDATMRFYDERGNVIPSADVSYETWGTRPDYRGPLMESDWDGTPARYATDHRGYGSAYDSISERMSRRIYSDVMTAVLSPADFSLVLSALHSTDGVTLVSNPKMLVTSGSTNAFFSVGTREPIIQTEVTKGTPESPGDMVISRLATEINTDIINQGFVEDGVDLRVVATVKTDDHIEAGIHPSLRRKIGEKVVEVGIAGAVNVYPILEVKDIRTSFTLRSGQTVAIGGLTQTRDDKQTTRVPILGSIPVLGRLFRHERDVKSQVETIIFVTLSVGDPDRLGREAGIPEDSRLVHTRLIREQADRAEFQRQLSQMQEAQDAAEMEAASVEEDEKDAEPEPTPRSEPVLEPAPRRSRNDQPVPR